MGIASQQPVVIISAASSPTTPDTAASQSHQPTLDVTPASLLRRKPVKISSSIGTSHATNEEVLHSTTTFSPPPIQRPSMSKMAGSPSSVKSNILYPQVQTSSLPLTDARGMGMGIGKSSNSSSSSSSSGATSTMGVPETPKTPKTFQQTQDELFSKLEALAVAKSKSIAMTNSPKSPSRFGGGAGGSGAYRGGAGEWGQSRLQNGISQLVPQRGSSISSLKVQTRRAAANIASGSRNGAATSNTSYRTPEQPRQPRRRINSAQFKTPSVAEMEELAKIVVANASPPKTQNKLRKRASTLSLTTTTYTPPHQMAPEIVTMTPGGGLSHLDHDYKKRYEAAAKDAKQWEKKYSALQHQIHYERERWEEKYGTLEKTLRDVENSKVEANIEKMNSLLNMIQQLQVANEVFRKQLKDAGIEPDPMPAAQFHSHCLLVGENLDRTFLEENELMKERSLAMNQKITHLSTEMNNAAIAISQTINYVQLRYLTQMLDAAEHVTSQKRARAMSNTFLSDMLSRGVKKAGPLQPKNTCTIATQTPSAILTAMQMQQQHEFQQQFMRQQLNNGMAPWGAERIRRLESKRSRSFMSLAGIIGSHGANGENDEGGSNGTKEIQYKLKGGAMEDSRSQLTRQAISSLVIEDLKGSPVTPDTADLLMATKSATPTPKFQYASPTSSQLRIFVPDVNYPDGYSRTPSAGSRSRASSLHRRSVSDISVAGIEAAEGSLKKSGSNTSLFPPKSHEPQSQRGMVTSSSSGLPRSTSQQFLSPEMAILYSNSQ